ncbi:hypothetical protein [Rhizobium sp. Rhizsp42]|uniref:hypothetical protein n=1 Tax=Rhizobium sp. Rhizsp42 TaxID=3243034 RepID=UPI0039AEA837
MTDSNLPFNCKNRVTFGTRPLPVFVDLTVGSPYTSPEFHAAMGFRLPLAAPTDEDLPPNNCTRAVAHHQSRRVQMSPSKNAAFVVDYLRLDLRTDDRVEFSDGMICRPKSTDETGHFFNPIDNPEYTKFVSHADYYNGIVIGDIRVEEDYFSVKKTRFREVWGDPTLAGLTADSRARVYRAKSFIDRDDNLISVR